MNFFKTIINKRYSLLELFKSSTPFISITIFAYTYFILNNKISCITTNIKNLENNVADLEHYNKSLKEELRQKNETIDKLINEVSKSEFVYQQPDINSSVLISNNEMTQFYIKTAGVIVLCLGVFFIVKYYAPMLSIKAWIPTSMYSWMQNNTMFFQERRPFSYTDMSSETQWLVTVINDRSIDIQVKPFQAQDYMSVSEYITNLQANAGTLTTSTIDTTLMMNSATAGQTAEITNNLTSFL